METKRLQLRAIQLDDAERIELLAGDYDVAKSTLNIPYPYPKGGAVTFIERVQQAEGSGQIVLFAIVEKISEQLVGVININVSAAHERGELAYWIGKDYWGKGYGTEAAKAVVAYGFVQLQLHKVFAASFTSNVGSWRIMEKIGLYYEGTLKQHVARFGQFHDVAYYGMTKDVYEASARH